jgi:hypothetical protein
VVLVCTVRSHTSSLPAIARSSPSVGNAGMLLLHSFLTHTFFDIKTLFMLASKHHPFIWGQTPLRETSGADAITRDGTGGGGGS